MSLTYLSLEVLDIVYTPLQLSVWKGLKHTHQALKHVEIKSVRDIADFWKETLRITDDKAGVEYYSRGYYPSERQDAHREGPLGAILDVDETETAFAQAHALLVKADVPHAMHRSYSDGLPDKGHRYRIFLPWCAEGGAARRHLVEEVFEIIEATPKADSWSKSGLYVPTLRMDDNRKWEILVHESGTWRPSEPPVEALEREAVEAAAPDTDLDAVRGNFDPADVRALLTFAAKNQMMDDEADWKRIAMMVAHWNHPDAETMLDEISAECSGYDASENEKHYARFRKNAAKMTTVPVTLKSLMKDAWAHGYTRTFRGPTAEEDFAEDIERERARAEQEGEEPPRVVEVDGVGMFTDIWRAQRVRQQYGHEIRWADNLSHWLNYDGVRWRMDRGLRTSQKVQEEAKVIWRKALSQPDPQKGKNPWKRAAQHAQTSTGIGHTMTLLKSQDGIKVEEMALDADIYLLNLENGTLNLRNHELQPHNPNDLITKLAPTAYKPEARCAHWDKFILEALPDREIRDFFQRLMGYALQGGQEAKAFGIVTGPADGGKSTALLACAAALGGSSDRNEKNQDSGGAVTQAYACSTSISTFASKKQDASGNNPALVRLMGARLITISEVKQKDALKSELMKGWTGGDVISATPKYGHPVDFKPNGTIVLVGNELPEIEFEDDAMWGRVMIVPFDVSCPPERQDKKLMEKFDLEAVLAWMVEGHKRYQVLDGLRPPKECQLKKTKHKEDMDPLAEFWDEQVQVVGLGGPEPPFVTTAELYHHYLGYCDGLGIKNKPPCTKKAVTRYANRQAAASKGIQRREGNSLQRGWLGIIAKAKEVGE